jgi:adenylate cyclase
MAGDIDFAMHALSVAKQLHPSLSVEWVERYHSIVTDKDRATYIGGLRVAGLT